jgi:hypothetical protein
MSRKIMFFVTAVLAVFMLSGIAFAEGSKAKAKKAKAGNILYVCNCSDNCTCDTVSMKPGKCKCGQKLAAMHILKIEGEQAILCTCGKDCTCKLDPNDPSKCGCGKNVRKVSIKDMYVCACGPDCACNMVSDKPAKCKCGAEMKKL